MLACQPSIDQKTPQASGFLEVMGVPTGNQSMATGNLALQCSGSKEAGYWGSVVEKSKHWTGIDGQGSKAQERGPERDRQSLTQATGQTATRVTPKYRPRQG